VRSLADSVIPWTEGVGSVFVYKFNGSAAQLAQAQSAIQSFTANGAPKEMTFNLDAFSQSPASAGSGQAIAFDVAGVYLGKSQAEFQTAIAPLLAQLPTPANTTITTKGWIDTLLQFSGYQTLSQSGFSPSQDFCACRSRSILFFGSQIFRRQVDQHLGLCARARCRLPSLLQLPLQSGPDAAFVGLLLVLPMAQRRWSEQRRRLCRRGRHCVRRLPAFPRLSNTASSFALRDSLLIGQLYVYIGGGAANTDAYNFADAAMATLTSSVSSYQARPRTGPPQFPC
jgi:hypothetical protein